MGLNAPIVLLHPAPSRQVRDPDGVASMQENLAQNRCAEKGAMSIVGAAPVSKSATMRAVPAD